MTNGIPERDATPDEAFELGRIAGYDEANREHDHDDGGCTCGCPVVGCWPCGGNPELSEEAQPETGVEWEYGAGLNGPRGYRRMMSVPAIPAGPWLPVTPEPSDAGSGFCLACGFECTTSAHDAPEPTTTKEGDRG
jgi:hypothetical protein